MAFPRLLLVQLMCLQTARAEAQLWGRQTRGRQGREGRGGGDTGECSPGMCARSRFPLFLGLRAQPGTGLEGLEVRGGGGTHLSFDSVDLIKETARWRLHLCFTTPHCSEEAPLDTRLRLHKVAKG
uniref:Uncharacterized protein n=1 Tax=Knipowitschia caucasica TaxID=637954 RepID=A0AAV2K1I2_KNICA